MPLVAAVAALALTAAAPPDLLPTHRPVAGLHLAHGSHGGDKACHTTPRITHYCRFACKYRPKTIRRMPSESCFGACVAARARAAGLCHTD